MRLESSVVCVAKCVIFSVNKISLSLRIPLCVLLDLLE